MSSITTTISARDQIGAALKAEALRRGGSVATIAAVLSLSKSSVYRRLRGETPILLKEVCAIAPELGMDAVALLTALKPVPVASNVEMGS